MFYHPPPVYNCSNFNASTACAALRRNDFLARYGGDEFALICCRREGEGVGDMTEAIRRALEDADQSGGEPYRLSASVGWAELGRDGADTADRLIAEADRRMFAAKRERRNAQQIRE